MLVIVDTEPVLAVDGAAVGAAPVGRDSVANAEAAPPEQGMVSMNAGEHCPP